MKQYQALYRKYRPRSFNDVTGQQHITQTLRSQIETGRLSHAYLFVGTRGTGKTTCAKILSRAINCLSPVNGEPCNECASCIGIENGTVLDVLELDAASNNGVEDIRELRDEAIYTPASVKKRIFILDEVHMLSSSASNALLKILEEPPGHLIFILATTDMHKVSATIQSRCQRFLFRRLSVDEIASRLTSIAQRENLVLTQDAAAMLARLADGSMRDGVSLLDQCITGKDIDTETVQTLLGLASHDELSVFIGAVASHDIMAALGIIDNLYKSGKDISAIINEILGILRDMLVVQLDPSSALLSSGLPSDELARLAGCFGDEHLKECLDIIKEASSSITRSGASKLTLEMCAVSMCREAASAQSKPIQKPPVQETMPRQQDTKIQEQVQISEQVNETKDDGQIQEPLLQEAMPPQQVPAAAQSQDDILVQLLGHISDKSLRAFFDSSSKARATFADGRLTIYLKDEFNAGIIKNSFTDALKEAAAATFGRDVILLIKTDEVKNQADTDKKLKDLLSFGDIVRVE